MALQSGHIWYQTLARAALSSPVWCCVVLHRSGWSFNNEDRDMCEGLRSTLSAQMRYNASVLSDVAQLQLLLEPHDLRLAGD